MEAMNGFEIERSNGTTDYEYWRVESKTDEDFFFDVTIVRVWAVPGNEAWAVHIHWYNGIDQYDYAFCSSGPGAVRFAQGILEEATG